MRSFYACRSQKRKKDSQLKQLFAILGSAHLKAEHKHVDDIDPRVLEPSYTFEAARERVSFSAHLKTIFKIRKGSFKIQDKNSAESSWSWMCPP